MLAFFVSIDASLCDLRWIRILVWIWNFTHRDTWKLIFQTLDHQCARCCSTTKTMKDIMVEIRNFFMMTWTTTFFFYCSFYNRVRAKTFFLPIWRKSINFSHSITLYFKDLLLLQSLIIMTGLNLVRVWVYTVLANLDPYLLIIRCLSLNWSCLLVNYWMIYERLWFLIRIVFFLVLRWKLIKNTFIII